MTRNRIRFGLELTKPYEYSKEFFRKGNAFLLRARASQFEFALLTNGVLESLTPVSEFRLEVKALGTDGVIDADSSPLILKIVSAVDFNTALTQTEWDNDSGSTPYHIIVPLSEAETALSMTGAIKNQLTLGWVATGITTIGIVTFGTGIITLLDDGGRTTADGPAVGAESYPTIEEMTAALANKVNMGTNDPGVSFTLTNADGWGIRFSITEGANPSPVFTPIAPPS